MIIINITRYQVVGIYKELIEDKNICLCKVNRYKRTIEQYFNDGFKIRIIKA